MSSEFFIGWDIGQSVDYSAIAVVERREDKRSLGLWTSKYLPGQVEERFEVETVCHCRHLERLPLGMSYVSQIEHVAALVQRPELQRKRPVLVLDHTGCGRPVFDSITAAKLPAVVVGITLHGGRAVTNTGGGTWAVPKRDVVAAAQIKLQNGSLKIAASLSEAQTLIRELQNFKMTIDPQTAHDSYGAWREHEHDDLLLALCLTCWYGEHYSRHRVYVGGG